jgi:hypothetical protein
MGRHAVAQRDRTDEENSPATPFSGSAKEPREADAAMRREPDQPPRRRYNNGNTLWTPELSEYVKTKWAAGVSAGQLEIDPFLDGKFSRCAIVSKIDRLGFQRNQTKKTAKERASKTGLRLPDAATLIARSKADPSKPFVPIWRISPDLEHRLFGSRR